MHTCFGECREYRWADSLVNGHASLWWWEGRDLQSLGVDLMDSLSLPCHATKIILLCPLCVCVCAQCTCVYCLPIMDDFK